MRGRDVVALGRDRFLAKAPPFTGDILWEHLEILQKGKCVLPISYDFWQVCQKRGGFEVLLHQISCGGEKGSLNNITRSTCLIQLEIESVQISEIKSFRERL